MDRPIVVGVDRSPESVAALEWAAEEAQLRARPLQVLHAWEWHPRPLATVPADKSEHEWAQGALNDALERVSAQFPELPVEGELVSGAARDVLVAAATRAEMLVIGSRGIGTISGFLVGSVGLSTVARAERPVVLVRSAAAGNAAEAADDRLLPIAVGLDAAHHGDPLIEFAFEAARVRSLGLRFVYAYSPPSIHDRAAGKRDSPYGRELLQERQHALADVLSGWRQKYPDVAVTEEAVAGKPARVLLEAAAGARLLALGRPRRPARLGPHVGPVIHAATHHAPCPVAVVPHERSAGGT
ncbi:universal stress protein [Streptomyces lunaelactis]|nr:universal stress protein [Streptomyces lunaelactis]NUK83615.1 universal stress protein [Streptomyces lunaelactis]